MTHISELWVTGQVVTPLYSVSHTNPASDVENPLNQASSSCSSSWGTCSEQHLSLWQSWLHHLQNGLCPKSTFSPWPIFKYLSSHSLIPLSTSPLLSYLGFLICTHICFSCYLTLLFSLFPHLPLGVLEPASPSPFPPGSCWIMGRNCSWFIIGSIHSDAWTAKGDWGPL